MVISHIRSIYRISAMLLQEAEAENSVNNKGTCASKASIKKVSIKKLRHTINFLFLVFCDYLIPCCTLVIAWQ